MARSFSKFDSMDERVKFMKTTLKTNDVLHNDGVLNMIMEAIESGNQDVKHAALVDACSCFTYADASVDIKSMIEFSREAIVVLIEQGVDPNYDRDLLLSGEFMSVSDVIATCNSGKRVKELIDYLMTHGYDIHRKFMSGSDGSMHSMAEDMIRFGSIEVAKHILEHHDLGNGDGFSVQSLAREAYNEYESSPWLFRAEWYYMLLDQGLDLDSHVYEKDGFDPVGLNMKTHAELLEVIHKSGGKIDPSELRRYQIASLAAKDAAGNGPGPKRMPAL
jgi:hypothetical protein